jgi:hypothetical protein
MTPKEKAEELVDKIYYCQRYADGEDYIPLEAVKRAKQCALIAVDEILDTIVVIYSKDFEMLNKYWGEVRHEINKL